MRSFLVCLIVSLVVVTTCVHSLPARPVFRPRCGFVCAIWCPNGNVMDSRGCPTCKCRQGPRTLYVMQDNPEPAT
ncbi:BPTI/Kunitz domain-containing protein 1-like [Littorina saxatilis]|uniref:Antistasin-like domain-containing protein n=1 Tax=Littorina saxatilis TaxID=31220 RepID=A0AAN9AL10_9CAEN